VANKTKEAQDMKDAHGEKDAKGHRRRRCHDKLTKGSHEGKEVRVAK
jgi:hypothetical protein